MTTTSQNPIEEFESAVVQHMRQHRCTRERAVSAVKRKNPALAKSYIVASQRTAAARREAGELVDGLPG